jgi:hypothetical protein
MSEDKAKSESSEFKARPFNKKIFEKTASLPKVNKRQGTSFEEFTLSKSNSKLNKKTLE